MLERIHTRKDIFELMIKGRKFVIGWEGIIEKAPEPNEFSLSVKTAYFREKAISLYVECKMTYCETKLAMIKFQGHEDPALVASAWVHFRL